MSSDQSNPGHFKPNKTESVEKNSAYKGSGVDVETGDELVDWLQSSTAKQARQPHQDRIISGIGGFASLFRADFPGMEKPCLVTCTDGVGTKVKIAAKYKKFSGIGQDLVAMCVNDLICTGGRPLLFLDYYAVAKLDLVDAKAFLQSVREACRDSDCALVGGETAEMPGVYQNGDFDCAGFAVGVVDESKALGAHKVHFGDVVIGISSSGFHSNGYSLLRKLFAEDLDLYQEELLRPTALYVKVSQDLMANCEIHAFAHITGGGIENIPRVLPENSQLKIARWEFPPLFKEVQKRSQMSDEEILNTLNCGIGLVAVLPAASVDSAKKIITSHKFEFYELGQIEKYEGPARVTLGDEWILNQNGSSRI